MAPSPPPIATVLKSQFQRVEDALTTLIDSIASYNPSPQAAIDLIAADEELISGLDLLSAHHDNLTKITALQATHTKLEGQVKDHLRSLAALRHEVLQTPATKVPENSRVVPIDELLLVAKNISKYTVPPTYREPLPKDDALQPEHTQTTAITSGSTVASPIGITPTSAAPPETAVAPQPAEDKEGAPPQQAEWLKKLQETGDVWTPWPNMFKIEKAGLTEISRMLDKGEDPSKVLRPHEREEFERRKAEEEEQARQEQAAREEEERRERERRMSGFQSQGARPPSQPAVFGGLDMYDPDEDME